MNKRHRLVSMVISLVLLNVWAGVAAAAPLRTISYQGYLKDGAGVPVTATVNLTFGLYSSTRPASGPFWREIQNVKPVNGVYSVELGKSSPLGSLSFDQQYFLGVAVESDPELIPRQPLTGTAYAFRAGVAESVMGSSIGAAAIIDGSISAAKLDTAYVRVAGDTMTGTLLLPASGLKVGANELVVTGGKVGIGTALPQEQLQLTGNLRLPVTTASTGIIKMGADTLLHALGVTNFFAGIGAGNLGVTGGGNTAAGYRALAVNSLGYSNTAMGYQAMSLNTTAGRNTAVGVGALSTQSFSNSNVLWDSFNTAVGSDALTFTQPTDVTNGSFNTALGGRALENNTTGYNNVGIGYQAGLPAVAGFAQTTGNNNTFIGVYSGLGTATQLTNATAIGYNSRVGASNSLVLGGLGVDAVKVGIGTATPTESLDVIGNVRISGTLSAGTIQKTLVFPAGSLSYPPGSTMIMEHAFGLLFTNSYSHSTSLTIPRPSDWIGADNVIIHLFVYVSSTTTGTMQFFVRPRTYASGDSVADVADVLSDLITVSSGNKYYELQILIPAARFGVKPWWNLTLQRNSTGPTYTGDAVLTSFTVEYTAVR